MSISSVAATPSPVVNLQAAAAAKANTDAKGAEEANESSAERQQEAGSGEESGATSVKSAQASQNAGVNILA